MTVRFREEGSAPGGLRASTPVVCRRLRIVPITLGSVMHAMALPKTRFGDAYDPAHVERINALSR